MHIAYVVLDPGIPLGHTKGAAVHVEAITRALRRAGHRVTVLATAVASVESCRDDVELVELDSGERRTVRRLRTLVREELPECRLDRDLRSCLLAGTTADHLARRLAAIDADVVLERLCLFGVAGLAAARRAGIPHTLEINAPMAREAARHRRLVLGDLAEAMERRVIRDTDVRLVVSEPLARYCRQVGGPGARTRVVSNGVDPEDFRCRGRRNAVREELGFAAGDCVVGMVSTLRAWHGGCDLVRAFRHVQASAPDLRLLIVGDGPDAAPMRSLLAEAGLEGRARFLGAVAHEQIPALMEAVDVAVAPYRPSSDFYFSPLKIFEAMAMQRAIVAPKLETITDVVSDRLHARLFEPGDVDALGGVLLDLARSPVERQQLGDRARVQVLERFTWARAAAEVASELEAVRARVHASGVDRGEIAAPTPAGIFAEDVSCSES